MMIRFIGHTHFGTGSLHSVTHQRMCQWIHIRGLSSVIQDDYQISIEQKKSTILLLYATVCTTVTLSLCCLQSSHATLCKIKPFFCSLNLLITMRQARGKRTRDGHKQTGLPGNMFGNILQSPGNDVTACRLLCCTPKLLSNRP